MSEITYLYTVTDMKARFRSKNHHQRRSKVDTNPRGGNYAMGWNGRHKVEIQRT